jgi:malonyl-CoA decarboxylase
MPTSSPFSEFLAAVAQRGRSIIGIGATSNGNISSRDVISLCHKLLSSNGEASGIALSFEILQRYQLLDEVEKLSFFQALHEQFAADSSLVMQAAKNYLDQPSSENLGALSRSVEPPRRKLIIRLNQAPNATLLLINMRADLLDFLPDNPELKDVDRDFATLFASWFNGGFLQLRNLDWTSPADMLEKLMRYEAVHGMDGWTDLRERIAPQDRLIYGFFHPRLGNEPLIFIEIALMKEMPSEISKILEPEAPPLDPASVRTAVFYSISNCQKGLRGIPLGSFLIKQVVEDLKKSFPELKEFVTLSPVPGFASWLKELAAADGREGTNFPLSEKSRESLQQIIRGEWIADDTAIEPLKSVIAGAAAHYLAAEKDSQNRPKDPVAKFHLGNGARLERINWPADLSENGLNSSLGLMVNYLYRLNEIEKNHELFVRTGEVKVSSDVAALAKSFDKFVNRSNIVDRSLV